MLITYDTKTFANRLKDLRKSMGYTILDVTSNTGINATTINKIENAKAIPRFDTLKILSDFYKCDLVSLFNSDSFDNVILSSHHHICSLAIVGDAISLDKELKKLQEYLQDNKLTAIEEIDLQQLVLYVEGLILASKCQSSKDPELDLSIAKYCNALLVKNQLFNLVQFEHYKYTSIEINILYSLAIMLGLKRDCNLSNRILFFAKEHISLIQRSNPHQNLLLAKLYYVISYNYHRLDKHHKALKYADDGIKFCIESDTHLYLPLLLGRKGIAMKFCQDNKWDVPIVQAITILELQEKTELIPFYRELLSNKIVL